MNEQNIKLPDFLIADLYKNTLVEILNKQSNPPDKKEIDYNPVENLDNIKFFGKNNNNVLIVTNTRDDAFFSENDLFFLIKILKACNLNLSDTALVNYANQEVNYLKIKKQFNPEKILLFGVKTSLLQLPFTVPDFQVQSFDSFTILQCPALREIDEQTDPSKVLKLKLWAALKGMFNV